MKTLLSLLTLAMAAPLTLAQQGSASLSPILMYVADRNSADAAAPRIQRMIEQVGIDKVTVDQYDLLLLRGTSCFGSPELQAVMKPFLPQLTDKEMADVTPFLQPLSEMWQAMDDLTATLNRVTDKATADSAAELLDSFAPFMASRAEKLAELTEPTPRAARRELRMRYLSGNRRHVSKFLQAWGALALRDAAYFESERLMEGLLAVRDVLENMNMQVDPDAIPGVMKATRELEPLMRQWVALIALVRDKDSADVVSLQLSRLHREMRAITCNAGISRSYEEDMFLFSPELEILVHIMDRVSHYLQDEVKPAFFGSRRLRSTLEHED